MNKKRKYVFRKTHICTVARSSTNVLNYHTEPVERPPPPSLSGSRMLRGLMLRMGKIFWARADVWRLLFCKVTTKKGRQKIEDQLL